MAKDNDKDVLDNSTTEEPTSPGHQPSENQSQRSEPHFLNMKELSVVLKALMNETLVERGLIPAQSALKESSHRDSHLPIVRTPSPEPQRQLGYEDLAGRSRKKEENDGWLGRR
ncbi:MAG: hypothetical protein M1836_003606 [Candelina mexicana]|nr:MAG: hypothetical protein M1836_003606 [Candelina mexicana]